MQRQPDRHSSIQAQLEPDALGEPPAGQAIAVAPTSEEGTVLAEYGLTLVVVGTVAAVFLRFVTSGSILQLLTDVLDQARALVGL